MRITAEQFSRFIEGVAARIKEHRDELVQLDSAIGDADHGINMDRGFTMVSNKLPTVADKDIGSILKTVGMTLVSTVGGASGPLYGTMFMRMGDATAGKMELTLDDWAAAIQAGYDGVLMRGKAQPGDKTMIDALTPARSSLKASVHDNTARPAALNAAAAAAEQGMNATIPLIARKGRASYLGERSAGHLDPGATS